MDIDEMEILVGAIRDQLGTMGNDLEGRLGDREDTAGPDAEATEEDMLIYELVWRFHFASWVLAGGIELEDLRRIRLEYLQVQDGDDGHKFQESQVN